MNNKGFISTTLIISTFLLASAIILLIIGIGVHAQQRSNNPAPDELRREAQDFLNQARDTEAELESSLANLKFRFNPSHSIFTPEISPSPTLKASGGNSRGQSGRHVSSLANSASSRIRVRGIPAVRLISWAQSAKTGKKSINTNTSFRIMAVYPEGNNWTRVL